MVLFPNAKINLGLLVTGIRPDGYHDLSTIMLPIDWCDILELVPGNGSGIVLHCEGGLEGDQENNLVIRALRALESHIGHALPPLDVYLKKIIPMGAGLGGGSSDASFALKGANELFCLGLDDETLASIALTVGADCPFFIYNRPALATGVGEILEPVDTGCLRGRGIVIAKPQSESVSTREAYAGVPVRPLAPGLSPATAVNEPIGEWHSSPLLINAFEESVFPLRPEIERVKHQMYDAGALFASMSGSGAAVYGIFESAKMADGAASVFEGCEVFVSAL